MSDVFREVDEEVRKEAYLKLLKRFGPLLLGLAFLIVGAIAVWRGWQYYREKRLAEDSVAFEEAIDLLEGGDVSAASDALVRLGEESSSGFATAARMRQAEILQVDGDREGAIALYDHIADDSRADPLVRQLAAVKAAILAVEATTLDEIYVRLDPLTAADAPFRYSALELRGLAAYRGGDMDVAYDSYEDLVAAVDAPTSIRDRAREMLTVMGPRTLPAVPSPLTTPEDAGSDTVEADETGLVGDSANAEGDD